MLNVKLKKDMNEIKFEDLEVGTMFIWKTDGYDAEMLGMKIAISNYDENDSYYILDLSDDVGTYYTPYKDYKIIRIIDNMELIEK